VKALTLKVINFYQHHRLPLIAQGSCRFAPTCSDYAYQAIDKYGILKGSLLSLKRIIRCHPWSAGGLDPLT
jgi:putative membrane protein insertion efficiency factor